MSTPGVCLAMHWPSQGRQVKPEAQSESPPQTDRQTAPPAEVAAHTYWSRQSPERVGALLEA